MTYELPNGKKVTIPNEEIKNNMTLLGVSKEEAIQIWLDDNDYTVNEEQEELDTKAKKVKIQHDAIDTTKKRGNSTPRTVKVSDEKKELFDTILTNLTRAEGVEAENVEVLRENKLIQVKIGDKIFKIDLIEQRKPKK